MVLHLTVFFNERIMFFFITNQDKPNFSETNRTDATENLATSSTVVLACRGTGVPRYCSANKRGVRLERSIDAWLLGVLRLTKLWACDVSIAFTRMHGRIQKKNDFQILVSRGRRDPE